MQPFAGGLRSHSRKQRVPGPPTVEQLCRGPGAVPAAPGAGWAASSSLPHCPGFSGAGGGVMEGPELP